MVHPLLFPMVSEGVFGVNGGVSNCGKPNHDFWKIRRCDLPGRTFYGPLASHTIRDSHESSLVLPFFMGGKSNHQMVPFLLVLPTQ